MEYSYEQRLDYDMRTDSNPVYVGRAVRGTDVAASGWQIDKITYDGSSRITRTQTLNGIWNNRTSLGWT